MIADTFPRSSLCRAGYFARSAAPAGPPILRGLSVGTHGGTSTNTVALPSGTIAGDLGVIIAADGWIPSAPAGWTTIHQVPGGLNILGCMSWKVLDSGDVSTGSITYALSGAFGGDGVLFTIQQGTFLVASPIADWKDIQSGAASAPVSTAAMTAQARTLALYALGTRGSAITAITSSRGATGATGASPIGNYAAATEPFVAAGSGAESWSWTGGVVAVYAGAVLVAGAA